MNVNPIIVAEQNFVGQTGSIPATTLHTVGVDNNFRVSIYITPVKGPNENQVSASLGWTDENGAQTPNQELLADNEPLEATVMFRAVAGSVITFSAEEASTPGFTYSAYIVVEKLPALTDPA